MAVFEFRILGPLEARRGGDKVELGGRRQRRLLAALVLEPGERVSVDRLVESIWDHEPPPSALHLVHVYVSQLRSLLDPSVLQTRAGGYTLEVDHEDIDAVAFDRSMRAAVAASTQGRLADALELYEEALGLWRGAVLEDVDPPPALRPAVEELEERRLLALEQRAEAMLELGRHHELVPELERLVSKEPLRERLRGQLMLALYRSGRQADALAVYRNGRKYLSQQLGMEPAPQLRGLERAILAHDPSLAPPIDSSEPVVSRTRPRTARRQVSMLIAITTVLALVAGGAIAAVVVSTGSTGLRASLGPGELGLVDAHSGRLLTSVRIGGPLSAIAPTSDSAWVADASHGAVLRVDERGRLMRGEVPLSAPPHALAVIDQTLWIADGFDGKLQRLNGEHASKPFPPTRSSRGRLALAVGAGRLWVASQDGFLICLDPRSHRVVARIRVGLSNDIVFDDTGIWVAAATQDALIHVDPSSGTVRAIPVGGIPSALAAGAGSIWAVTSEGNRVWRIDPRRNAVTASLPAPDEPGAVAVAGGLVWVASKSTGELVAIAPATGSVARTLRLRAPVAHLSGAGSRLWLTLTA